MISVDEALAQLISLVDVTGVENVPLNQAHGRTLATDVVAHRDQPPFAASAMDGYAVRSGDMVIGAELTVIGEAAAGHRFDGVVGAGQAARIFTGAPLPKGANHVLIQENTEVTPSGIRITDGPNTQAFIRPAGADFTQGFALPAPRILGANDIALLAAMNHATVPVRSKPTVAIIPTGDELVQPGEHPSDDQIVASNSYGLAAMLDTAGAIPRLLPIARDRTESLHTAFELAAGNDIIVTIGGASVGDHDLVAQAAKDHDFDQQFFKVAMRPGKPLMSGRMGSSAMVGLPGNPVSAMVCGAVFLVPMIQKILGFPAALHPPLQRAPLAADIPANGPRAHYMRAYYDGNTLRVADRQDSALLTVLADANALAVRTPHAPAEKQGEKIPFMLLP